MFHWNLEFVVDHDEEDGLVNTICTRFSEYTNHTQTGGPITDAVCFLAAFEGFNCICPYQMEDGILV